MTKDSSSKLAQILESWKSELQSSYLYRTIANVEKDPARQKMFRSLAESADHQAKIWEAQADSSARANFRFSPDLRTRSVAKLVKALGPQAIKPVLAAMKVRGLSVYSALAAGHPHPAQSSSKEYYHRSGSRGGNLRAAVFGANDGLLSNMGLILGIAGAAADNSVVLLAGVAGLLAGAFSMAAGEYVSVRSQRELFEYQIGLEKEELERYPEEEAEELSLIYQAKGITPAEANRMSQQIIQNPAVALDTLAREELGLNPDELGSPWGAAIFSLVAFASGAIIPVLPFLFLHSKALPAAIFLTASALFGLGLLTSLFTGRSALWGGLRMLLIGVFVGCITFEIGKCFGRKL